MSDDAVDLLVAQLRCGGSALFRIGRVVFGDEFELGMLAADHHVLRVEIGNGHPGAVFVVLAVVGLRTRDGTDVTDADGDVLGLDRASAQRNGCGGDHVQIHLHVRTSGWGKVECDEWMTSTAAKILQKQPTPQSGSTTFHRMNNGGSRARPRICAVGSVDRPNPCMAPRNMEPGALSVRPHCGRVNSTKKGGSRPPFMREGERLRRSSPRRNPSSRATPGRSRRTSDAGCGGRCNTRVPTRRP